MHPDGPEFYFRSLESLWAEKFPIFQDHPSYARSLPGGLIDAAVMFVDICGFSSLVAKFKDAPQGAAFAAHHFLAICDRKAYALRGKALGEDTIRRTYFDKVVGDAVLLVVTGPRKSALEGALQVADLITIFGLYPCKAGLHWGTVWLGDVGLIPNSERREAFPSVTVMGHVVNIAARLVHQADEDEIALLGEGLDGAEPPLTGVTSPDTLSPQPLVERELKGVVPKGQTVRIAKLRQTFKLAPGLVPTPDHDVRHYLKSAGPPARLD